ncbi:TorD/DmsD family molecular chaperone [Slackia exigua]|uniref:TorD/DmsD family molecular chaperone n=1 Tax=Slackia exigua TaxID=84109 RepID=UPI002003659D|nr:molecular chaperone TorD family protein [Slackia exigua]MCK6138568.1 molecular chaperone TorD family protein [Slackia exigua]
MVQDGGVWRERAESLAFLGNSLLSPMNQTETYGLDPSFWAAFPDFEDNDIRNALLELERFADAASRDESIDWSTSISVEFTKLFIGPPKPAAAPWETFYRSPDGGRVSVGFGKATFEMRQLLRDAGLQVRNDNNQYPDHIGIELLYASVSCSRIADLVDVGEDAAGAIDRLRCFISGHPYSWIDRLIDAVRKECPDSYIFLLLKLARAILRRVL